MALDLSRPRITRNVRATVSQVLLTGIVFFILYKYLYSYLGVQLIGVWSLVLATTTVTRIGDLGLSAGVVRFVAKALGQDDNRRAADVVETVALTLALCMAGLLLLCYPLFVVLLGYLLPPAGLTPALEILPFALTSLWLMLLSSVFSGGLDACMRMDLRSYLMMISHLVYLGVTVLLVPQFGLRGVAIAQVCQSLLLVLMLWWTLKTQLLLLSLVPCRWRLSVLKELLTYGVSFQVIMIVGMFMDPLTKGMMSKYGGLDALGFYEMANKLILQGRALIVEASRVTVAVVASEQDADAVGSKSRFLNSYQLTVYVSLVFYGIMGIFASTISFLWLGRYEGMFIFFVLLLNLAWFTNTLVAPAYFYNLGSGHLRNNVVSHLIMGAVSLSLGITLGTLFNGQGVLVGTVLALIAGSSFLLVTHMTEIGLTWRSHLIPNNMSILAAVAVTLIFATNLAMEPQASALIYLGLPLLAAAILFLFAWVNPARKLIISRGRQ